ncbi:MAG: M43 family zinc metalloprotease [Bacteroidota bacterium]
MENQYLKNMRNLLLVATLLLSPFCEGLKAQKMAEPCLSDIIHHKLMATNPEYAHRSKSNEILLQKSIANNGGGDHTLTATFTIPCVVHVIHLGEAVGTGTNISNAQILSAISSLTNAYRKLAGSQFDGNGVDTGIEFCLAQKDPSGNPTTGINRINGTGTANYENIGVDGNLNEVQVKALSFWDNQKYYNIWVVSEIDNNGGGSGTQGYAYYPPPGAFTEDGTIVLYNSFGFDPGGSLGYNLKPYTNLNMTMIHEMGHALNLHHTFDGDVGGVSCPPNTPGQCATEGDLVCDIPPHKRSQSNCVPDATANSCSPGSTALDYQHNYMDYSSDACTNMFTAGQSARTTATLNTLRSSLVTTSNLAACGCSGVSVSIAVTGGSNPTCTGQSITFTATPVNAGSPTYQWYLNGTAVNLETGVTYTTTTLTNQSVTCIMTSGGAFTSNAIVMSLSTGIVPAVATAVTSGSNPTCSGAAITFTATPTSGGTTPVYQWKLDGVNVATGATYTSSSLTNGQVVTCVMTSNLSCASPTTATSSPITITTSGSVAPTITTALTSGTNPACGGQSFTFAATSTNGGTTPVYQWKVNGVNVAIGTTYTSSSLTNGQVVTCVMTSNQACANPATIASTGITITITSTPQINFVSNKNVCGGAMGATSFSSTPSGATYAWTNSNTAIGLAASGTGSVPAFTAVNSTNAAIVATVTVTPSINGSCTGIPSTYTITVSPTPVITQSGGVLSSSTASSYQWYWNGQPVIGATSQTYTPTQNGDFTVIAGGSTCSSNSINVNNTGIDAIVNNDFFTVYPNPNDGNFNISFCVAMKSTYKLTLLNALGALVYQETLTDFNGTYSKQMDLTKFGKGIYLISISNPNIETVKKVIVY